MGYIEAKFIVARRFGASLQTTVLLGKIMYTLALGILLALLKYLEIGPVATWSWWWVLSPFALTVLWWAWADSTGYTKRKAMEKMDQRKKDRIDRQKEALGMRPKRPR